MNGHSVCCAVYFMKIFSQIWLKMIFLKTHTSARAIPKKYWPTNNEDRAMYNELNSANGLFRLRLEWTPISKSTGSCVWKATHAMLVYHAPVRRVNNGEMKSDQQRVNNARELNIVELMYWIYLTNKITPIELANGGNGKYLLNVLDFDFAQ